MAAQERSPKSGGFVEFLAFHFGLAFEYLPGKTLTESNWPTFLEYAAPAFAALSYFGARFTINVAFNSIYWRGRRYFCFLSRVQTSFAYNHENVPTITVKIRIFSFQRIIDSFHHLCSRFHLYLATTSPITPSKILQTGTGGKELVNKLVNRSISKKNSLVKQ